MTTQPVIDELRSEHRTMTAMFAVIDEEMEAFAAGGAPDFERLLAAVEYCHAYPGAKHHPKEDVVFQRLTLLDAETAHKIGDLEAEHEILGNYTRRFKSAIERVLSQENINRDELMTLAEEYSEFLRRHMHAEETVFFPAALDSFTDEDWRAVDDAIAQMAHTDLDPAIEARFQKLRDIVE